MVRKKETLFAVPIRWNVQLEQYMPKTKKVFRRGTRVTFKVNVSDVLEGVVIAPTRKNHISVAFGPDGWVCLFSRKYAQAALRIIAEKAS